MSAIAIRIGKIRESGKSWPDVFREILSDMHPDSRTYVHLFCELAAVCKVEPGLMDEIRYWNYWHKVDGYDDEELDGIVRDKIYLK